MTEGPAPPPLPRRPYRKSLLINLVLAGVLFAFSWGLGGRRVDAVIYATFYLVVATGWNWWRLRQRLARERE